MSRLSTFQPAPIRDELLAVVLPDEAKVEIMDKVTTAIRKAETTEAALRSVFRVVVAAAEKFAAGGFG